MYECLAAGNSVNRRGDSGSTCQGTALLLRMELGITRIITLTRTRPAPFMPTAVTGRLRTTGVSVPFSELFSLSRFLPSEGLGHHTYGEVTLSFQGIYMEELGRMESDGNKSQFARRGFLGVGSAARAAVAGGLAESSAMAQAGQQAGSSRTDRSATDPGPTNKAVDAQNSDSAWPPATDSKSLVQTFKYPFSFANKRTYEGGWSREVTVRELAVSKTLAGVNMRLTAGGVRELHWHTADELPKVLYGTRR